MPQVFKVGSYLVFIWLSEGIPLEPIHVHVCEGIPSENATKIWIAQTGKAIRCHNKSRIPEHKLSIIEEIIESRSKDIINKWMNHFGEISYYC